ncbi:Hypothetical protein, putative [Bodo saltans]|uniref:GPI-anchored surface protein n=1 Tax=Bodo saltans TaxID=75058 RepID=A0A0S4JNW5_BODSA|nr:Hypothetical protein, putative [Bodo saltans]|eukprot:CUG90200.1 Hypothetical protein, putative [Bodo saltans]
MSLGYVSSAIGCLAQRGSMPLFLLALVTLTRFATSPASVKSICSAMTQLIKATSVDGFGNLTDKLLTQSVIDALISMSPFATTPSSVQLFTATFLTVASGFLRLERARPIGTTSRRALHGVIANKRVCDDAIMALSKFATTDRKAVESLVATISRSCDGSQLMQYVLREQRFSRCFCEGRVVTKVYWCCVHLQLVHHNTPNHSPLMMTPLAATSVACYPHTEAMLTIMARVPRSAELFACGEEVLRACDHLHRNARCEESRDSVHRLVDYLGNCLERIARSGPAGGRTNATRAEQSQRAGAAFEAYQTGPHHHVHHFTATSAEQSEDQALLRNHLSAIVADTMYAVSPILPLSRAPKSAMLSSAGCRQGDALGPLAVNVTLSHPQLSTRIWMDDNVERRARESCAAPTSS